MESPEPVVTTVSTLLSDVGSVFTSALGWVANVASEIVDQPVLLLFCVAVPLCGLGVGMFVRLLHSRG